MPGVACERATQYVHLETRRGHAAAAAMCQRHDTVDVRELRQQRFEPRRDHAAGCSRAIHRRHYADVVARRGTAVRPAIALEGGGRHDEIRRMGIAAERIVALELAHDAVVRMDVRAGREILGREADDLVVLAHRLALLHRPRENLVTGRHALGRRDVSLDLRAGQDVHTCHDDVVGGMQSDGEWSGHLCFLRGRRPCRPS